MQYYLDQSLVQLINGQDKIRGLLVLLVLLNGCLGITGCPPVNWVWHLLLYTVLDIGHKVRLTSTQH